MSFFVPQPGTILSRDIADYPEGIVLPVDKPYRWTSADVIRKLKYAAIRHFGKKNLKVGHAGTLDPLATGVLLVCIGPACREAQHLQDTDKEYVATLRFGATTPSYDLEKEVDREFPYEHITEEAVREALPAFVGTQEQVAPLFSAKSVDGVRAYELARKLYRAASVIPSASSVIPSEAKESLSTFDAAALDLLQRNVITISSLTLEGFSCHLERPACHLERSREISPLASLGRDDNPSGRIHVADTSAMGLPEAVIRIACSKGTYIRAFARDLGEALGSGAHLSGLIRSRSGAFRVEDALSLDDAITLFRKEA